MAVNLKVLPGSGENLLIWTFRVICYLIFIFAGIAWNPDLLAQQNSMVLDPELHHIRSSEKREWSIYPVTADRKRLIVPFDGTENMSKATLRIRQSDVKQRWTITLNGLLLGNLHLNESDITGYFPIPAGGIKNGSNRLVIEQVNDIPDDILAGEISIDLRPVDEVLSEGKLTLLVLDRDSEAPLPSRITITTPQHSLQTVGASTNHTMAVRPGVIYTGDGTAAFGLPAGTYTVYAGRGMEYGIDSTSVTIEPGSELRKTLSIQKQVNTDGYISSDTHTHTFTHSGHGDASIEERMLTIAGEEIELPIATDHNIHIDYEPAADKMNVRNYFTPVTGNEVTTRTGHFNIFPTSHEVKIPNYQSDDWDSLFNSIYNTRNIKVVILNHGRDVHSNFIPLSPENFNAVTGKFRKGLYPGFNAMEVINSGAHQTDIMQLFRDWFAMLNRGLAITPVAGSDAHDVTRFILGQARTYIQTSDAGTDPSNIDVEEAANRVVSGKVNVGMGLFAEIAVNGKYGPGFLVPGTDSVYVEVKVQGPDWATAETVELYRNGNKIRTENIENGDSAGLKWNGNWTLEKLEHDSYLVAVAKGPGVEKPFWPIARPWQPDSPEWIPHVIAATGAVWLDEDGNGKRNSAYDYALALVESSGGSLENLLLQLSGFDQAVAIQAAELFFNETDDFMPADTIIPEHLKKTTDPVKSGFMIYLKYWQTHNELP